MNPYRNATRSAALIVAACCAILLAAAAFTRMRGIDTNIDTGNVAALYIVSGVAAAGFLALVVCVVAGLARLFRLSEDHHVYGWWAVAVVSIVIVVVAGSII